MPITKSSIKRVRVDARKTEVNKAVRSGAKTKVTRAEKAIQQGITDETKESVKAAISTLDKAASKGVIHPNNAARRKSRLMKKLNTASKK